MLKFFLLITALSLLISCEKDTTVMDEVDEPLDDLTEWTGSYSCEVNRKVFYSGTLYSDTTYYDTLLVEDVSEKLNFIYNDGSSQAWLFDEDSLDVNGYYNEDVMYGFREITLYNDSLIYYRESGDNLGYSEHRIKGLKIP